jgi:hypothetical protein
MIGPSQHNTHKLGNMRFKVLTAACMKMAVFWDVAPCGLVEVYRRFRGACCPHHRSSIRSWDAVRGFCTVLYCNENIFAMICGKAGNQSSEEGYMEQ